MLAAVPKQKWIAKSDVKAPITVTSFSLTVVQAGLSPLSEIPKVAPSISKVSDGGLTSLCVEDIRSTRDQLTDPPFPPPPGWGAMSNKEKKKQLKMNNEAERRSLWDDTTRLSASSPLCNSPWLLVGDFNQIASITEHYSLMPSNISLRGLEDLQAYMRDSDLVDLPCRGVLYTWSNHQQDNPILRKLDRAIVNGCWLATFPTASAIFDPPSDSDHAACMVILNNSPPPSKKKSFKYFSFLSRHPDFISSILAAWQKEKAVGSFMFSLGELLKEAKKACRDLNRRGFSNIQQRTKESLSSLEDIQAQLMSNPSDFLFRAEHVARKNWNFFASSLESFYKQKSRIKWLKEGDLELLTSYLEEAYLIMSKHSTPRSTRSFKISRDHSTPRSSRRNHHFTSPLDHEVECPHLHHLTITRSNHSTPWSSVFTFIARPLLDLTTLP
ncbi:putative Endonuclease/exonuclease/phosphatase superfamily [Arabidopsis thaliana]